MKIIVWCLCMLFSIHAFADGEEGAKVGDQSPDFEYEDKDGKIYSLKDFRGKYVLIDFWATYCAPCKKEIPYLEKIQEKFKKKNIFFVSIAIDLNKKEWIQFLEQNPFNWCSTGSGSLLYIIIRLPRFLVIFCWIKRVKWFIWICLVLRIRSSRKF
jgi:thiol-disulfide isomerase/thioredoxin